MEQKHLLFATYEIHPVTAGGCGVFIWHAINELLRSTDYKITLLLDIPKFECEEFIQKHKPTLPNNERLKVVCLSDRIPWDFLPMESFNNMFLFKSYMFYRVLEQITQEEQIDYVEFFDYVGIGYFSVNAKKYEGKFNNTILGIRGHCTVDLMDLEQCQSDFSQEKIEMYQMEKIALQNADVVLVQTEAWKELYATRYGIKIQKIVVSEPPMDNSDFPKYEPHDNKNVLFYGRVFQLKGIDDYIQAGIQYLIKHKNQETKFYIVGYDGATQEGTSYTEHLKRLIPNHLKEQFVFTGKLSRDEFKSVLDDISVAVFPNYVESFCYSIHELYEAGVPIICRQIPAFSSYFENNVNCKMFYDDINQISNNIEQLLANSRERKNISYPFKVLDSRLNDDYNKVFTEFNPGFVPQQEYSDKDLDIIILGQKNGNYLNQWAMKYRPITLYQDNKEGNVSVELLGNTYTMPEENLNRELKKHVVLIPANVIISEESILQGLKYIKYNNCQVIGFNRIINEKVKYCKISLNPNIFLDQMDNMIPLVIRNHKITITQLFEQRCGLSGLIPKVRQGTHICMASYTINGNEILVQKNKKQLILFHHRETIGQQWSPDVLNKFLKHKESVVENNESKLKVRYHEIQMRLLKSNSKHARVLLRALYKAKNYYKKTLENKEK